MGTRVSVVFAAIILIAFAVFVTGCKGPQARRGPAGPPVVVEEPTVVIGSGPGPAVAKSPPPPGETGPPAHAPAHGYRRKHAYRYHYYPSAYVYYCPKRGLYWYMRNGRWEVGANLPGDISIKVGERVSLGMDIDTPYVEFEAHKKAHPPGGKAKKQDKPEKGKGKGKNR
jgi:hypothetical protein